MHEAAHTVDLALARELIAASFPEHGDAVLRPVATIGTVNTIVRVGEDLVARFPLLPVARAEAEAEAESMTALAVSSPFPAPLPRGVADGSGELDGGFRRGVAGAGPDRDKGGTEVERDPAGRFGGDTGAPDAAEAGFRWRASCGGSGTGADLSEPRGGRPTFRVARG